MSKRQLRWLAVLAAMGAAIALPIAASAETVADCQAKTSALRARTEAVVITGQNAAKNRSGLLGKLDDASAKLAQARAPMPSPSCRTSRRGVEHLRASGAISAEDAQSLLAGAGDAIVCIESL